MMMTSLIREAIKLSPAILVCGALACGSDAAGPKQGQDVEHRFWGVTLNYHSVTLSTFAPFDTLRIVATPLDAFGVPLAAPLRDSAVTKFVATDPTDTNFVLDSLTGFFRARHPEQGILIQARTTVAGMTRVDTLKLNITDVQTPPVFSRLALQTVPTDTVFQAHPIKPYPAVVAQALDRDGNLIDAVTFAFRSSDPRVVSVFPDGTVQNAGGLTQHLSHGTAFIYASATVYGITRVDSIPMTVTFPYVLIVGVGSYTPKGSLTPVGYFLNPVDTVAIGATVGWQLRELPDSMDVVFDDPSKAEAAPPDSPLFGFANFCDPGGHGNMATWAADSTKSCGNTTRWRYFSTPGTYRYHSERYGSAGTLVVQ